MHRRALTILCAIYFVLLAYASLMPYDLVAGPELIEEHVDRALNSWPLNPNARISRADMLSNFVLYIPLGVMLSLRLSLGRKGWLWRLTAFALATLTASATSLAVEALQLRSLSRIAGFHDWFVNTIGGGLGALWGAIWGRSAWLRLRRWSRRRMARRPISLVAAAMLVLLAADAAFPYRPTLDRSDLKRNVLRSAISPSAGLERHPWHHWVARQAGVHAVLAALIGASMVRSGSLTRWAKAFALTAAFIVVMEMGKLFIVSRSANAANVVMGVGGALFGCLLGAGLRGRLHPRGQVVLAACLVAAYLVYLELTPFAFRLDWRAATDQLPEGAEWLPLYHYGMGGRAEDVLLFTRTIVLNAAMTCSLVSLIRRPARRWKIVLLAGFGAALMGAALESGQLFLDGRVASVTDVFCFAVGGTLGAKISLTKRGMLATVMAKLRAHGDSGNHL